MKKICIDENYDLRNYEDKWGVFDKQSLKLYLFDTLDDIPLFIKEDIRANDLKRAFERFVKKDYEAFNPESDTQTPIEIVNSKPYVDFEYTKQQLQLVKSKFQYEDYYKIRVDPETGNKYYFDIESHRYRKLSVFELGYMIERDFTVLLNDMSEIPLCLSDSELNNIYKMFHKKDTPDNNLICFENTVINTNKDFTVKEGDCFTINNIYYNYYNNIDDCKQNTLIERVLREIFINKETSDETLYIDFLQHLGASFLRQNKHKFIYMMTGSGNDGKSIVLYILSLLFNDLCVRLKVNDLTDRFFTINLGYTNILIIDELNRNSFSREVTETLKDITGRGSVDSRVMYSQETVKVKDYGIPFVATNIVPAVPFDDTAYWERLHLIKLPNKFVKNKELYGNEYLKDENLEEKIDKDKEGIEWLISASINAYRECKGDFLFKQDVNITQMIYEGDNPLMIFIRRFVNESNDNRDVISNLEIKYYFLRFCMKNDFSRKDIGVSSSKELSQEIGLCLRDLLKYYRKFKDGAGYISYSGIYLNIDDKKSFNECKEEIKDLENIYF